LRRGTGVFGTEISGKKGNSYSREVWDTMIDYALRDEKSKERIRKMKIK